MKKNLEEIKESYDAEWVTASCLEQMINYFEEEWCVLVPVNKENSKRLRKSKREMKVLEKKVDKLCNKLSIWV